MKLDGDGGNVTAHGYLSYVRDDNTSNQELLRFMLNTGSIAANDYLRFAAPVRAGHMVTVDSQLHGVAARPALVTSMIYYETAGKAYTDMETIGFRDGSIKNDGTLDLSKVVAARRPNVSNLDDMVDDDYGGSYTFEDYKPHYRGQFYPGKSSSSDSSGTVTEKDDNVSWNAGTLYVGTETYAINAGCTDGATYGINGDLDNTDDDIDGNPNTHYIIFFDPHVSTSEFVTLTEEAYEQRNSSVGRSTLAGSGDLYPLSAQNLKIARVGASSIGANARIELFISQGAPTDAETSGTDSTIVYAQGSIGGAALAGDVATDWRPSRSATSASDADAHSLGTSSAIWKEVHARNGSINTSSDRREKKNIKPIKLGLDFINDLNPVSFEWQADNNGYTNQGIIAQEVLDVLAKYNITNMLDFTGIKFDEERQRYIANYNEFLAPMMKAIQELSDKVNKLENEGKE